MDTEEDEYNVVRKKSPKKMKRKKRKKKRNESPPSDFTDDNGSDDGGGRRKGGRLRLHWRRKKKKGGKKKKKKKKKRKKSKKKKKDADDDDDVSTDDFSSGGGDSGDGGDSDAADSAGSQSPRSSSPRTRSPRSSPGSSPGSLSSRRLKRSDSFGDGDMGGSMAGDFPDPNKYSGWGPPPGEKTLTSSCINPGGAYIRPPQSRCLDITVFRKTINRDQFTAIRWYESATHIEAYDKQHVVVIVTETNLFLGQHTQGSGGNPGSPVAIGLETVVKIARVPERVELFIDEKVNETTQTIEIEYKKSRRDRISYVVLCAWEVNTQLFFHLTQAWLNLRARMALPGIRISVTSANEAPMRELYMQAEEDILRAQPPPSNGRVQLLRELAHGAIHNRELRLWCFQTGRLWKFMLMEVRKMQPLSHSTIKASDRARELEYVHALYATLHAVVFNSEMVGRRLNMLHPTPFDFGEMLSLLAMDFGRKAAKAAAELKFHRERAWKSGHIHEHHHRRHLEGGGAPGGGGGGGGAGGSPGHGHGHGHAGGHGHSHGHGGGFKKSPRATDYIRMMQTGQDIHSLLVAEGGAVSPSQKLRGRRGSLVAGVAAAQGQWGGSTLSVRGGVMGRHGPGGEIEALSSSSDDDSDDDGRDEDDSDDEDALGRHSMRESVEEKTWLAEITDAQVQLLVEMQHLIKQGKLCNVGGVPLSLASTMVKYPGFRRRVRAYVKRLVHWLDHAEDGASSLVLFSYCKLVHSLVMDSFEFRDILVADCAEELQYHLSKGQWAKKLNLDIFFSTLCKDLLTQINEMVVRYR